MALSALAAGSAAWLSTGGNGHTRSNAGWKPRASSAAASRPHRNGACHVVRGGEVDARPQRALLSILGVLRRPPTPADRLPSGLSAAGAVFAGYVRRTRVIGSSSYFIYPVVSGCRPGREGIGNSAINVDLGHGLLGGVGGGGATAHEIEAGEAVSTGPPGSDTTATITMIIPDGVARVTLDYPAGRASGYSPLVSPPFTITTAPVGNELVVTVPRSAGGGPIWRPTMTWRASDGRVLRRFDRL